MKFITKVSGVFLLVLTVFALPSLAHNYHTSLTRIDYNKKEKSLEIEINLFNHDLEKVLESKYKKRIDFEKSKEMDKMLFDYLKETFLIKDEKNAEKKLVWVGKEIDVELTTMFVEVKEIDSIEKLELQNKLFFESFAEQVNLVTLHTEDKKLDLAFKVGDGFKPFVTENPKL
ncbi:hypothetical protein BH20ACI4_BH20ACI4_12600 [soil metagenome]